MSLSRYDVELAYHLFLDRQPTAHETKKMLGNHKGIESLRTTFLNSAEFSQKYLTLGQTTDSLLPPTLIHLHIPKTAGTSLAEALSEQPPLRPNRIMHDDNLDELNAMPLAQKRALRYIRGHLSFGAGKAFGLPHRFICLIRRPGPRIFSFYQFIRRTRVHPTHALLNERKMSFGDYLEFSLNNTAHRVELDNGQIRRLAGEFAASGFGKEQELMRTALYHAVSPDMLFGLVEHIDSFIALLVDQGYLPNAEIGKTNVSPNSQLYESSVASLTKNQRGIFDKYTAWDSRFHDICQQLVLPPQPKGEALL